MSISIFLLLLLLLNFQIPVSELVAVSHWVHMRALTGRVQNEWRSKSTFLRI